jgi:hypothetical protein
VTRSPPAGSARGKNDDLRDFFPAANDLVRDVDLGPVGRAQYEARPAVTTEGADDGVVDLEWRPALGAGQSDGEGPGRALVAVRWSAAGRRSRHPRAILSKALRSEALR